MIPEQHFNHVHRFATQLTPISGLNEANLETLCKNADLVSLTSKRTFDAKEETRWILYLLKGEAVLEEVGDRSGKLEANTPRALQPLFEADSISGVCKADSGAVVLKFDRQQYQTLFDKQISDATQVSEIVLDESDQLVFNKVYQAMTGKPKDWPFLPEIGNVVRQALEHKDSNLGELTKLLHREPLLAARLVKVANEGTYSSGEVSATVSAAINRLGVTAAREQAIAKLMNAPKLAMPLSIRQHFFSFYGTALRVSALSYVLARKLQKMDAEKAMLAGLVHEIGCIPILLEGCENAELAQSEGLSSSLRKLSGIVGSWVLSQWHYDRELIDLCSEYNQWYRSCGARLRIVDVVTAAHLIEGEFMQKPGLPSIMEVPIGRRLKERGIDLSNINEIVQATKLPGLIPEKLLAKAA